MFVPFYALSLVLRAVVTPGLGSHLHPAWMETCDGIFSPAGCYPERPCPFWPSVCVSLLFLPLWHPRRHISRHVCRSLSQRRTPLPLHSRMTSGRTRFPRHSLNPCHAVSHWRCGLVCSLCLVTNLGHGLMVCIPHDSSMMTFPQVWALDWCSAFSCCDTYSSSGLCVCSCGTCPCVPDNFLWVWMHGVAHSCHTSCIHDETQHRCCRYGCQCSWTAACAWMWPHVFSQYQVPLWVLGYCPFRAVFSVLAGTLHLILALQEFSHPDFLQSGIYI